MGIFWWCECGAVKNMVEMEFVFRSLFVAKKKGQWVFGRWCEWGAMKKMMEIEVEDDENGTCEIMVELSIHP